MSQTQAVASPDLLTEAERLIRSLAGVLNARVHASGSGIDAVHVEVGDPAHADVMAAHVRSALLAGLATPVTPARIHVRVAELQHEPVPPDRPPDHRIRLVQDTDIPTQSPAPRPPRTDTGATGEGHRPTPFIARPRLVALDLDRPGDGRVSCTVTVAYHTDVHTAKAVAVDLPGAAAQAAAQATVRALGSAGLDCLELDGLREVEIAGRDYVLVALRRANHYTRVRSGSAPITGAPERAAAKATVDAAARLT